MISWFWFNDWDLREIFLCACGKVFFHLYFSTKVKHEWRNSKSLHDSISENDGFKMDLSISPGKAAKI